MKWLGVFVLVGCTPTYQPSVVRSFQGTLVEGGFVSPSAYQHYVLAQIRSNDGRREEAVQELRYALASDGASAYLHARLGEELLGLGRIDEAREEVQRALDLDPQFAEARVDLGRIKLKVGDAAGAEAEYKKALQLDRGCEEGYIALAALYQATKRDSKSADVYKQMASALPQSVAAQEALANIEAAQLRFEEAATRWRRILLLDPTHKEARLLYAQLLQSQGRFDEGEALLQEGMVEMRRLHVESMVSLLLAQGARDRARNWVDDLARSTTSSSERLRLGWLEIAVGRPERAIAVAKDASDLPLEALQLQVRALEKMLKTEEAIAKLRAVSEDNGVITVELGRLLSSVGRYQEAIELFSEKLKTAADPVQRAQLEIGLANAYESGGDGPRSIGVLEAAATRQPTSESLLLAFAGQVARSGDAQRALKLGRRFLERTPDNGAVLTFVGLLLAAEAPGQAKAILDRAARQRPLDAMIFFARGRAAQQLNQLADAEMWLERAARLRYDDPEILFHLGGTLAQAGERTRALTVYRRAMAQKPAERWRRHLEAQILNLETGRVGSR